MIKYDLLNQILVIINSACLGGLLALIYDAFSFFEIALGIKNCYCENKIVKKYQLRFKVTAIKKAILIALDILYFLTITPICAIFLYKVSLGILRWYYVCATIIGVLLYRLSIGVLAKKIILILSVLIRYLLNVLRAYLKRKIERILKSFKRNSKRKMSNKKELIMLCSTRTGNSKGRAE